MWLKSIDRSFVPGGRPVTVVNAVPSAAGKLVTSRTMQLHAVAYACIRVISTTMASVTLNLNKEERDGTKTPATAHRMWKVIRKRPNPFMTPYQFRNKMYTDMLTVGNAYAQLIRNDLNEVVQIWPLNPDRIKIYEMQDGSLIYEYYRLDGSNWYGKLGVDVTHWMYHTQDGRVGINPLEAAAQTIGLGIAQAEMVAAQAANSAAPAGILKIPGIYKDDVKRKKVKESWEAMHKGPQNRGRVAVLDSETEWITTAIPNKDLEWLETMKKTDLDVTRYYGVPPAKVNITDDAHFNNVSAMNVHFIEDTLRPIAVAVEQCFGRDTLQFRDFDTMSYEHNLDSIERGDIEQRWNVWTKGRQWGILSPNDIAKKENLPRIPAEEGGDERMRPANYVPLGTPPPEPKQLQQMPQSDSVDIQEAQNEAKSRLQKAQKRLIYEGFQRIIAKESKKIEHLEQKIPSVPEKAKKMIEFYSEQLDSFSDVLLPAVELAFELEGERSHSIDLRIKRIASRAAGKFVDMSVSLALGGNARDLQTLIDTMVLEIEEL